jgi:guanylate kinase
MAKLFVLSAPSGAGKSTLIRRLLAAFPELVFSVSATTRKPRAGEKEGREYFFKRVPAFEAMIRAGELAEHQRVHGNYYGTPRKFIEDMLARGRNIVLDIDVYGKTQLDRAFPEAVGIFIDVPSLQALEQRLKCRQADDPAALAERMRNARNEMAYARRRGKYEHTVMNDDLEAAFGALKAIIAREIPGHGKP